MNKEKLIELYEILIKGFSLTREILTIYNFDEEDIIELSKENIIKEIEPNKWQLTNIEGLYKYGIYLMLNQQSYKSEDCYRVCYKIEPTNRKVCMQLLLFELQRKNYIGAQKMFSVLEQIEPEKYKEDNSLYLYLLGIILYNNRDYQKRIKSITYEDVLIPNSKEVEQSTISNKIRCMILNQKYPYALNLINNLKRENITYNVEYELLKELTISAINLTRKFKYNIRKAAKNQDYNRILELLDIKTRNQKLSNMEINILLVTKSIIEIIDTNKIEEVYQINTTYLSDSIENKNFKLAQKLNLAFLEKTNQDPNEDVLNILLNDIIKRIESIKIQEKEYKENITSIQYDNPQKDLSVDEALAYYIKEMNLTSKEAIKNLGILPEQAAIINLIYARDYFCEGNYEEGSKILKEVEDTKINSNKIIELLNEIKEILSKEKIDKNVLSKTKTKEML